MLSSSPFYPPFSSFSVLCLSSFLQHSYPIPSSCSLQTLPTSRLRAAARLSSPCEDRQRHLQVRAGTVAGSPTPGKRGSFSASWRRHGGAHPPGPVPVPPSAARSLGSGCSGSTLASLPAPPLSPLTTLITRQALLPRDQTTELMCLIAEFLPLSQPVPQSAASLRMPVFSALLGGRAPEWLSSVQSRSRV